MKLHKLTSTLLATAGLLLAATPVGAQITNPAIAPELGAEAEQAAAGVTFVTYFVSLWRAVIFVGGLLVFVFFMWGALEWISAGGDASKVEKARNKITQAVVGLILLVASFTIIGLISQVFFGPEFNLLQLTIPVAGAPTIGDIPASKLP